MRLGGGICSSLALLQHAVCQLVDRLPAAQAEVVSHYKSALRELA